MNIRPSQSIASLLIHRVFKWVILCVVAISSLQAWLNYRAMESNFNMTVNGVVHAHLPLLSVAIWDIETPTIQKQIKLILKNTTIAYVVIRANTGQEFVGGDASRAANGEHIIFDIPAPNDAEKPVGTADFVVDRSVLRNELWRSLTIVVFGVLVLSIFIFLTVAAILRRDLELPMRKLADFVKNLQANKISTKLELELEPGHTYNEIDLVVDGFRTMQASIEKHIANQDALVSERTRQLETAMQTLKQLSVTDGLTGCYNRQLFNERMPAEIQRAVRYGRDLCVVFCDIDFFKKVNDQYGHAVGDGVLVSFAQRLKNEVRAEVDWVVRYGGEEFVIILPETGFKAAVEVARRIREQTEMQVITLPDGYSLHITASFGVAELRVGDTVETLVHRADQWMYFSKEHGRNQVQPTDIQHIIPETNSTV